MSSVYAKNRHPFLYKVVHPATGKVWVKKAWAKVRHARKPVELVLAADHVRKSMKLKGVGNTATCSMAICAIDHKDAFPHAAEGHIDWQYARAFVVSKYDKRGLPSECVAYDHGDDIARLNDSKGGQRRLLKRLLKDGPITIRLLPIRVRSKKGRNGSHRPTTGARSPLKRLRGAKLRYAVVEMGSLPV